MDLGPWEIAIIAVVILVLFGSAKLPQAARSLGRSMRIFKSETKGLISDDDDQPRQPQDARAQAARLREQAALLEQQAAAQQPQLNASAEDGTTISGVPLSQTEPGRKS
ncbi:Sec-independent protein translocase subunit TatA [Actinoallomurus rhizosphaericola]|uniref:Sec-independent protein translocase subunit TatA n=1 Tax=Actinoallomurus rhizosphaericola TaxID=2952536 RepID=UPI002092677E|nr:Sec-independent protein translocase subunit TatA [Actinoallomurus rhizosphaericola]MCO5997096.1 Sec-independent protein translocase subunit TatA [Actinoallomurus rhizosphaericola]